MKNKLCYFLLIVMVVSCQKKIKKDYILEIKNFQSDLIALYNSNESPIRLENKKDFKGLSFFPINKSYRIEADFNPIENGKIHDFQTSSGVIKKYKEYGTLTFDLNGEKNQLIIFQKSPINTEYANYLFLPFNDKTNGTSSYGAGRYLDLTIEDIVQNKVQLDFNKAYNPYCAYEDGYACPIPPKENRLNIAIEAGVSYTTHY